MANISVDQRSYELAEYFLPESKHEHLRLKLAQEIQQSIEDWIEENGIEE